MGESIAAHILNISPYFSHPRPRGGVSLEYDVQVFYEYRLGPFKLLPFPSYSPNTAAMASTQIP